MDTLFDVNDQCIKDYIMELFLNTSVSNEEFAETCAIVCADFMSECAIVKMCEERRDFLQVESSHVTPSPTTSQVPRLQSPHVSPSIKDTETSTQALALDRECKEAIIKKYALCPVSEVPCTPFLHFANGGKENKRRYRNGVVVTTKGEKYVS